MNTKELCLGTLLLGDASGYEIKAMFEKAFRHFQRTSYGSIYPALNALLKDGLVSVTNKTQSGRPDKKTYSITTAGKAHFDAIIHATEPKEAFQSDFLVIVLFSRFLSPHRYKQIIEGYTQKLECDLQELQQLLNEDSGHLTPEARFTIDFGIHALNAQLDFVLHHTPSLLQHHIQTSPHSNEYSKT